MIDGQARVQEQRSDKVLNAKRITFCVDTSFLVEFRALDQIPWREIAPNAAEIRIVVPPKVGEEMDEHKKRPGRLRRRGIEFTQIARRIEESSDERAMLRERDPQVTIEFGLIYRRTELDGDLYDLDDKDGRIVAEAAKFMRDHPDAVFLADDSKPLRWARQTGLLWRRPPESWRREEGPDERDKQIAELKRQLGPQPALSIAFPGAASDRGNHILVLEPAPTASCAACSDQLASAVLAANPKVPRTKSIDRYGLVRIDPLGISTFAGSFDKLTESDLDRYEKDYARFEERVRLWSENQPALFGVFGRVLPVDVEIANDGDCAAERVLVEFELTGAFHFLPRNSVADFMDRLLRPLFPPKPRNPLNFEPPFVPMREPPKPHVFYLQESPEADGSTTRLEWRCEELRHGQRFILPAIVRTKNETARGTLKVRVSSTEMAKIVEATALLTCSEGSTDANRLCAYFKRRVELFPTRYQEPVRRAIAVSSKDCSGEPAPVPESDQARS